jgi:hypothetical protein
VEIGGVEIGRVEIEVKIKLDREGTKNQGAKSLKNWRS